MAHQLKRVQDPLPGGQPIAAGTGEVLNPDLQEDGPARYDWSRLGESVADAVMTLIGDHYGLYGRVIPYETDLFRDLGSDAVDVLEIVITLEECFGVYFNFGDRGRVRTVGDAVNLVEATLAVRDGDAGDSQGKRKRQEQQWRSDS